MDSSVIDDRIREEWTSFIAKFNKSYVDEVDELNHFKRFSWNLRWMNELNSSSISYTVGITAFSDWLEEEIENHFKTVKYDSSSHIHDPAFESSTPNANKPNDFRKSLNWATRNNPLGRSVTTRVKNQNTCGACWAFTAAESTESSVAINTGIVESLSVQQLIDCDTSWDQGCVGGNPVSAYPYIINNGLAAETSYPYIEKQGECKDKLVKAVSGIKGYRRLRSGDQQNMLKALHHSPIAVGLAGTRPSFLMYNGGVYDDKLCGDTLNHAALLVGFGTNWQGQDYWIIKNSWGEWWGERGYMRIKRGSGHGDGICGIAKAPTYALGGFGGNISDAAVKKTDSDLPWFPITIRVETVFLVVVGCYFFLLLIDQLRLFLYQPRRERRTDREMAVELSYLESDMVPVVSSAYIGKGYGTITERQTPQNNA